jgi:hypothetical protein
VATQDQSENTKAWNGGETITVGQALELFPRLGLPHFQRGRVWGNDSIAALLESLFHNTPCGSFVFWKSRDNGANGVPIDDSTATVPEFLVIDGQQRIRSLHDAWSDVPSSGEDGAESKKVWCVNLSRVPRLQRMLEQSRKNPTIFVWAPDPADPRIAVQARRTNLIPLSVIRANANWADLPVYQALVRTRGTAEQARWAGSIEAEYSEIRNRILAMESRSFFVARRGPECSLAEMADLYNRINAGGKQVEIEERAFAALVGLQPHNSAVPDGLQQAFAAVHGSQRPVTDRDALMQREEERQFGFKLFIRIFLQVCQYHFAHETGKSSFSFDPVAKDSFREEFGARTEHEVDALWDETLEVTQTIHEVIVKELFCDDLRMLPDATGLMPVAQLLIQYPNLREKRYRSLLATLMLRIELANPDSREWSQWVASASDPTRNALQVVLTLHRAIAPKARARFEAAMKHPESSLQDRYVLLLYWLQRKLKTSDFCSECIPDEKARPVRAPRPLSREVRPEKGHLVPRSRLARVLGIDVKPTESHEINSIGNLTYMSYDFNRALGHDFPELAVEVSQARMNLASHLLLSGDSHQLYERFGILKKLMARLDQVDDAEFETLRAAILKKFSDMSRLRRRAIQGSFETWLEELDHSALTSLGLDSWDSLALAKAGAHRLEPQRPRFAAETQRAHFVRELGLPDDTEDHVLELIRGRRPPVKDGVLSVQLTQRQQVTVDVRRSGVSVRLRRLTADLRQGVLKALGVPDTQGDEVVLEQVPPFGPLVNFCEQNDQPFSAAYLEAQSKKMGGASKTKRSNIASEPQFWDLLGSRSSEAETIAHRLIQPFRGVGFELELGRGSLKVRSRSNPSREPIPLFFLKAKGQIKCWPKAFERRAKAANVSPALVTEYLEGMRRLLTNGSPTACWCRVQDADIAAIQRVALKFHEEAQVSKS